MFKVWAQGRFHTYNFRFEPRKNVCCRSFFCFTDVGIDVDVALKVVLDSTLAVGLGGLLVLVVIVVALEVLSTPMGGGEGLDLGLGGACRRCLVANRDVGEGDRRKDCKGVFCNSP